MTTPFSVQPRSCRYSPNFNTPGGIPWGNLVHAQKSAAVEEEGADLVPKSWQLECRTAKGKTIVLADGVLAYDINEDGRIVYTNGKAVFLLHPDGRKERVFKRTHD